MDRPQQPAAPGGPGDGDDPGWEQRVARAEINGRRVNEAIARGAGDDDREPMTFVCECGRIGCNDKLSLSRDDYERARRDFARFVLVPGHEIPEVDTVVERHSGFVMVEKHGEVPAEMAARTDERDDKGVA